MKYIITVVTITALFNLASCKNTNTGGDTTGRPKLLDAANMDTTVKPGMDFYRYANGTWLKNNPIPPSETGWGSFNILVENNYKALHQLLDSAVMIKNAVPGSIVQKVGDFYRSGMDSAAIDKAGITPLNDILSRINNVQDANGIINEIAIEHTQGIGPLFDFGVSPDDKNVTREICKFGQGGLGLPDRDYYFNKDEETIKVREAYKNYITGLFVLIGEDSASARNDEAAVYKLEDGLAGASMTRTAMRDPYKTYNKFNIQSINKETPGIDWNTLLQNLEVEGQDSIIVSTPLFFKKVAMELKLTPVNAWKKYLTFHVVNSMSSDLSSNFDQASFGFYDKILSGQQEQKPRWKRVLAETDGSIGELLGQMYVERYFTPEAKTRMLALVNNLQQTYAARIQRLTWMSDSTKKKALSKLSAFVKKIGYPDKWKDFSNLRIVGNHYVANVLNAAAFEYKYHLNKLGKPVDRTEWGMTPPTVNAYYNPGFNEIVFPAGILQYPFFDFAADDAVNYGGIGAVIGHEMTHGFDDQGRLYDEVGNLHNWWSEADAKNFTDRVSMVIRQFDSSKILDSLHVNGKLTQGENLADLGGAEHSL